MNREVFLSILAMDAYQRGYSPGINGLATPTFNSAGNATSVVKIGNATIARDSSSLVSGNNRLDVPAGFYALSYTWGTETIISYRGTDFDAANSFLDGDDTLTKIRKVIDGEFTKDLWDGWSTFTGLGPRSQFPLAEQFFNSVLNIPAGQSAFEIGGVGPVYSNVIVTGHSLGGALAGYIDARVDVNSYLVDPIPYGVTAWLNAISEAWAATLQDFGLQMDDIAEAVALTALIPGSSLVWGAFVSRLEANLIARSPQLLGIEGVYLEDEIATRILVLQPALGAIIGAVGVGGAALLAGSSDIDGILAAPIVAALGVLGISQAIMGVINNVVEKRDGLQKQVNHGVADLLPAGFLDTARSTILHSPGLISIILYGDKQWEFDNGDTVSGGKWHEAAKYFGAGIFDLEIANGLGLVGGDQGGNGKYKSEQETGLTAAGEQLARIIAYSAINEGTLVFGDTGIRALFNDADDLGKLIAYAQDHPGLLTETFDEEMKKQLGRLEAEFAGLLATRKVTQAQKPDATKGVFDYAAGGSNDAFRIDLRESAWTFDGPKFDSVVIPKVLQGFLAESGGGVVLQTVSDWYRKYASPNGTGDLVKDIDEVILSLTVGQLAKPRDPDGVALEIGTTGDDTQTFGDGTDFALKLR